VRDLAIRVAVASLLAAAGCASGPIELYEGGPRDRSEIAVIRRSAARADLTVFRIDSYHTNGHEWHVEPGPHRVWVQLVQYGVAMNVRFKANMFCSLDFDATAGDTYEIASNSDQRFSGVNTEVKFGTWIIDGRGATVAEPQCYDRPPRFDASN
jgi:hypothetical protein